MVKKKSKKKIIERCEICDEEVKEGTMSGCNECGKFFGPCCSGNDPDLSLCDECVEPR